MQKLTNIEDFTQSELDAIEQYVATLYAKDSELQSQYPELSERKLVVANAKMARLSKERKEQVMNIGFDWLSTYINEFLISQNSMAYAAMVAIEQMFNNNIKVLMEPLDGLDADKKLKAVETQEKISRSLSDVMERYEGLKKLVYSDSENEIKPTIKRNTPENYAAEAKNNGKSKGKG